MAKLVEDFGRFKYCGSPPLLDFASKLHSGTQTDGQTDRYYRSVCLAVCLLVCLPGRGSKSSSGGDPSDPQHMNTPKPSTITSAVKVRMEFVKIPQIQQI